MKEMGLLDVEKFVFYKGILGCPLREVPDNLIHEIYKADTLEIVNASDSLDVPHSLNSTSILETYNINDIDPKGDFAIRPKYEAWRRIVFNGKNIHSRNMATLCTLIIQHPEGVTKRFVKDNIPNSGKSLSEWIRRLEDANAVYIDTISKDVELIRFNYDLIENQGDPKNKTARPPCKFRTRESLRKIQITDEMIETSMDAIRDYPDGIPIVRLQEFLNVSDAAIKGVIGRFRTIDDFKVIENNGTPSKILFNGIIKTEYIDAEMVRSLLDMCNLLRIIVLSEQPKELEEMKAEMGVDDEKLMEILEDNDFRIMEIRYNYVSPEFVVFSSEIDGADKDLVDTIAKVKSKMPGHFRAKVRATFFKNLHLASFDNNYSPHLRERVMHFYRYVVERMRSTMFFFFNNDTLLEMNFFAFVRSVPLKTEFYFIEIMAYIGFKSGRLSDKITKEKIETLTLEEYEKMNEEYLLIAKGYTLGEVLDMLEDGTENKVNLLDRVNIREFEGILLSTTECRIFESYTDLKYIYFKRIKVTEEHIDKVLMEICDEAPDQQALNIPYPVRRDIFNQICEFSPDEFYSKTMDLIESVADSAYRESFTKKLQSFK